VQPFLIIHVLDEIGNSSLNIVQSAIFPEIDLLGFNGLHEALGKGVIVRVAFLGHADVDFVAFEYVNVVMCCVLHALVRVMDQSGTGIPCFDGHLKRGKA